MDTNTTVPIVSKLIDKLKDCKRAVTKFTLERVAVKFDRDVKEFVDSVCKRKQ